MGFNPYLNSKWTATLLLAEYERVESEYLSGVDIQQVSAGDTSVSQTQRLSSERRLEMIGEALYTLDPYTYEDYRLVRNDRTRFAHG